MNQAITYTKAIGIILVVLGHAMFSSREFFVALLNMFHVPLFFFVSGYCFKEKYLQNPKTFFKRKLAGIYWPYIKWTLIFIILHNVFYHLNIYNGTYGYRQYTSSLFSGEDMIKNSLIAITNMRYCDQLLGAFWFLKPLFVGSIIMYMLIYISQRFCSNKDIHLASNYPFIAFLACVAITFIQNFTGKQIPFVAIGGGTTFLLCKYHVMWVLLCKV